MTEVIVLNGGSSSGKSSIARALQEILPGPGLTFGVDVLDLLWAGVRCDPLVAAGREAARPGRVPGMAGSQAVMVHAGVGYDVEVDTTSCSAAACARRIAEAVVAGARGT